MARIGALVFALAIVVLSSLPATAQDGIHIDRITSSQLARALRIVDIRAYGAKPSDSGDDTLAIQAAFNAAATVTESGADSALLTAAGQRPVVFVPEGTYIVGTSTLADNPALNLAGNYIRVAGPGILKLAPGSAADSVLRIGGHYNRIEDITVDGNAAGSPTGRGEGVRVQGNYNELYRVTSQNTTAASTSGNTFFVNDNAFDCKLVDCSSLRSGENGIRVGETGCIIKNFRSINCSKKGFTLNADHDVDYLEIDGWYAESNTTEAASAGLQIDSGGSTGWVVRHAVLRNIHVVMTGSSFGAAVKFARVTKLSIDGIRVEHPNALGDTSLKIVEGMGDVEIKNAWLPNGIDQDPSPYDPSGEFDSVADSSGFALFTVEGGHQVKLNDHLVVTGTTNYNGLHVVTAIPDANTFRTNRRYVAEAISENTSFFYGCIARLSLENCEFGLRGNARQNLLSGLQVLDLYIDRCRFLHYSVRGIALNETGLPVAGIATIDVRNSYFESNSGTANYALRTEGGTEWGAQSRKAIWQNNTRVQVGANAADLANRNDINILLSCGEGSRREYTLVASTLPTGGTDDVSVTWQVGDRFLKPSPAAGASPGWVCTTSGTFATGTFTAMPSL
ncbi:MAG: glycosyl hydrolase family 28-related protein [Steroidobacteraceae bacterium]